MTQTRTIYRCTYIDKNFYRRLRDSRPFKTEKGVRAHQKRLRDRGFIAVVWRLREEKIGRRWEVDLDDEATRDLDS